MSAFLLASTAFTGMDRVVPKVAGVESGNLHLNCVGDKFVKGILKMNV